MLFWVGVMIDDYNIPGYPQTTGWVCSDKKYIYSGHRKMLGWFTFLPSSGD